MKIKIGFIMVIIGFVVVGGLVGTTIRDHRRDQSNNIAIEIYCKAYQKGWADCSGKIVTKLAEGFDSTWLIRQYDIDTSNFRLTMEAPED